MENKRQTKVYVSVRVGFSEDGRMTPLAVRWEDGRIYPVDRVLDVRPSGAAKAGGHGDRYTVRIAERETFLFFEHSVEPDDPRPGRWFAERREVGV